MFHIYTIFFLFCSIVGIERILEYTDLPTEAEWNIEETRPPKQWPQRGNVEFDNYATRYRPGLDLVLKGITISINEGEKVYNICKFISRKIILYFFRLEL